MRHLLTLTSLAPDDSMLQLPPTMCSVGFHSPRLSGRKTVLATPCVRAYVSALHVQLQRIMQALVALQQGNMAGSAADTQPAVGADQGPGVQSRPLTLLELLDLTSPAARRVQLLYASALAVMSALPGAKVAGTDSPRTTGSPGGGASDSACSTPSPRGSLSAAAARAASRVPTRSKLGGGSPPSDAAAKEAQASARVSAEALVRPAAVAPLQLEAAGALLGAGQVQATPGAHQAAVCSAAQTSALLLEVLHRQLQQFGPLGSPSQHSDHQV